MKADRYRRQRDIRSLEDAGAIPPPFLHPLAGAEPRHFRDLLARHRGIPPRSRLQKWFTWFALLERWPLAVAENRLVRKAVEAHTPAEPPVFLIGHWGSGTTRLHQLLACDPAVAFPDLGETLMPWNIFGTSRYCRAYLRPFIPEDRFFDGVRVSLEDPQEEEVALAAMSPVSYFLGIYFPDDIVGHTRRALFPETADAADREAFAEAYRLFFRRISFRHGGKRILFKNPASTTRMPMLRRLFPGAKFVHLVRNPFEVFASAINRTPYLLNCFAMQDFRDLDLHGFTLDTYESLMRRYLCDRGEMPPGSLVEVRFEELEADPESVIAKIYDTLDLPGADAALGAVGRLLATENPYRRTPRPLAPDQAAEVVERWRFSFEFWGYAPEPVGGAD